MSGQHGLYELTCCCRLAAAALQSCVLLLVDLLGSYKAPPEMKKRAADLRANLLQEAAKKVWEHGACKFVLVVEGLELSLLAAVMCVANSSSWPRRSQMRSKQEVACWLGGSIRVRCNSNRSRGLGQLCTTRRCGGGDGEAWQCHTVVKGVCMVPCVSRLAAAACRAMPCHVIVLLHVSLVQSFTLWFALLRALSTVRGWCSMRFTCFWCLHATAFC
jgi:hypothetical protein